VYRFLLKPRWILSHIFVLVVVGMMINFGFWQLNRLDERKASNAVVTDAMKQQPQPLSTVLPGGPAATTEQVKAADYQPVYVTGVYLVEAQVLGRDQSGLGAVLLYRGWALGRLCAAVGDRDSSGALAAIAGS